MVDSSSEDVSKDVAEIDQEGWPSLRNVRWPTLQQLEAGLPLTPGLFVARRAPHSGPVRCMTSEQTRYVEGEKRGFSRTLSRGIELVNDLEKQSLSLL